MVACDCVEGKGSRVSWGLGGMGWGQGGGGPLRTGGFGLEILRVFIESNRPPSLAEGP